MSKGSEPNVLMWLVTTGIALLAAGGGVVAYLRHFRPPRPKLQTKLWMLASPFYELIEGEAKQTIRRNTKPLPGPAEAEAGSLYPALELDVTNPTDNTISLNAVRFHFTEMRALRPPAASTAEVVVQYRAGASAESREALARKYGLRLVESEEDLYTYLVDGGAGAEVAAKLETESELVEYAFTNEAGEPHKKFPVTERVDLRLEPGQREYTYLIAESVEACTTTKIPIFVGASESLTGTASVALVFESNQSHDAGQLEITIEVPDYVQTTTAGGA
jgi:hypothetical protein